MADVVMPQLGESVTEGTITKWFKNVGDHVAEDETLFEVSTDKVDSEVPSPTAGYVSEIKVPEGETVEVGTLLVVLSDTPPTGGATPVPAAEAAASAPAPAPAPAPAAPAPAPAAPDVTPVATPVPAAASVAPVPALSPAVAPAAGGALLSPLVRRLVEEHGIDPAAIAGTGVGGRITRDDVLAVVDARAVGGAPTAPATGAAPAPASTATAPGPTPRSGETVVPFTNIRRRTGEHMVMSKSTSPHAITAVEVDYEAVERVRRAAKEHFKAEEGFSLTYLPFISRATVDALAEFPHMNATVSDNALLLHAGVNLSIAVDLDFDGLLAPVVKQADSLRLRAIARDIHDLADRARTKRLAPDDLAGGTFTLSNSGSYGTLFVVPIINQPQVAIMSTDGIRRRPVVVELPDGSESIAIHSVGLLTLSWDHRAFDGAYAAAFMRRVKEILETRDWASEL